MAVVRKIGKLTNKLLANNAPVMFVSRNLFDDPKFQKYWDLEKPVAFKEYMPGYYPKTEEERIKAAEKYGMHPAEYKPCPNDWRYAGDYPDLPWISVQARDPYYPWDYPAMRRNYDDPLHTEFDLMGEDRYDYGIRQQISRTHGCLVFLGLISGLYFLHWIAPYTSFPRLEKQFPGKGAVHYTFESAK